VTVQRVGYIILLLLFLLLAAVFAFNNPEPITVDAGFARFERVSMSLAFTVCFAVGWLFGLLSAGFGLLRIIRERRRLRRDLRLAEAELRSLRSLPLNDAD
jgi:lipopolysaccharide assembly protein A